MADTEEVMVMAKINYVTQVFLLLLIVIIGYWIFMAITSIFSVDIPEIFTHIGWYLIIPFLISIVGIALIEG